jgi:hypothetical protein
LPPLTLYISVLMLSHRDVCTFSFSSTFITTFDNMIYKNCTGGSEMLGHTDKSAWLEW